MNSSWLLDIFGDSDLRSSTKLRHIGNVKSVVFIKKTSLCSVVNSPLCIILVLGNTDSTDSLYIFIFTVLFLLQEV